MDSAGGGREQLRAESRPRRADATPEARAVWPRDERARPPSTGAVPARVSASLRFYLSRCSRGRCVLYRAGIYSEWTVLDGPAKAVGGQIDRCGKPAGPRCGLGQHDQRSAAAATGRAISFRDGKYDAAPEGKTARVARLTRALPDHCEISSVSATVARTSIVPGSIGVEAVSARAKATSRTG